MEVIGYQLLWHATAWHNMDWSSHNDKTQMHVLMKVKCINLLTALQPPYVSIDRWIILASVIEIWD